MINPEAPEAASETGKWVEVYRGLGWKVFPICRPVNQDTCVHHGACPQPGKRPLIRWSSYRDGQMGEDDVAAAWERYPDANIGLVAGDVVVLDLDGLAGVQAANEKGLPAGGPRLTTGRPGGEHRLFTASGHHLGNWAGRLNHVDLRGYGGYSILPPSLHASGRHYAWIEQSFLEEMPPVPDWVADLADLNRLKLSHKLSHPPLTR